MLLGQRVSGPAEYLKSKLARINSSVENRELTLRTFINLWIQKIGWLGMPTKAAGHSLYNGSTAEVGMHYQGFQCRLDMLPDVFEDRYPPGLPPSALFRERLARLKSSLNLTMVRKYKYRRGNNRVQGGPDLTASAEYPIQLGLKAWPLVLVALAPWYTNLKLYWPL